MRKEKTVKDANGISIPTDKVNSVVWLLNPQQTQGKVLINLAKSGSKEALDAVYSIKFDDDLRISKQLTPYDRRVYIAVSYLYYAGDSTFSLTQIHYAMGGQSRPQSRQLKQIKESLLKMMTAVIHLDNADEAKKYKKRKHFDIAENLLSLKIGTADINGKITESAVHVNAEPPLMMFAMGRGQITSIPLYLYKGRLSLTSQNIAIEDYLLRLIVWKKHSNIKSFMIEWKSLYDGAGIHTPKQRQRALDKVNTILQYYQEVDYIKHGIADKKCITISL